MLAPVLARVFARMLAPVLARVFAPVSALMLAPVSARVFARVSTSANRPDTSLDAAERDQSGRAGVERRGR